MKWTSTLLAYERDIKNRTFWDWLKAHTSFMYPLHRYIGTLEISKGKLRFNGEDSKKGGGFSLEIKPEDIISCRYGFDSVFRWWEERAAPWNKPLRVRYKSGEQETIYLFANFHHKYGLRGSDNPEVEKRINSLIAKD